VIDLVSDEHRELFPVDECERGWGDEDHGPFVESDEGGRDIDDLERDHPPTAVIREHIFCQAHLRQVAGASPDGPVLRQRIQDLDALVFGYWHRAQVRRDDQLILLSTGPNPAFELLLSLVPLEKTQKCQTSAPAQRAPA